MYSGSWTFSPYWIQLVARMKLFFPYSFDPVKNSKIGTIFPNLSDKELKFANF